MVRLGQLDWALEFQAWEGLVRLGQLDWAMEIITQKGLVRLAWLGKRTGKVT